eukprot:TRINITY_DN44295_c0_g1_i1.p1 TRINITY_DN44295_c0_g1~~TRINITY_DN44295_c0_g1_i1.p1  ORF type:complete len:321 (+),score=34.61 TRINITY_DN44295_c0_g1_i1:140-1102(+)
MLRDERNCAFLGTFACMLVGSLLRGVAGFGEPDKFLIVSSPSTHRIAYLKLPSPGGPPTALAPMHVLVDSGLSVPQGIAVDEMRKKLYVADPDLGKLISYDLHQSGDILSVGKSHTVATGVEVRWVTVDGVGNVYFTDEAKNKIYKVSASAVDGGSTTPTVLFDGQSVAEVSGPGGIVTDNFFLYWVNKLSGTTAGSLLRGVATARNDTGVARVSSLSKNTQKSYGVCLGLTNIFYTDETKKLYALPRTGGGNPLTASASLTEPRGCAFDGSSTVYVADKSLNAVYSLASSVETYAAAAPLTKAADLSGAFGVAVYKRLR